MAMLSDHEYMVRALQLAERGLYSTDPNPRVGCVIVRNGQIVGEAWHHRAGEQHAEVLALAAAADHARGAVLYVTLEPCCHFGRTPPCSDAIIKAGVSRVVYALSDPDPRVSGKGAERLRAAAIEVSGGVLADRAAALNRGFVMRWRKNRPYVVCKIGMTLDGHNALAHGESRWITSQAARQDVHRLRARSSAIMTGIGTVLTDDPALTVRLPQGDDGAILRQPLRIVIDPGLRISPHARLLHKPGHSLIVTAAENAGKIDALTGHTVRIACFPLVNGMMELHEVLTYLAQLEINELLLEAGAGLNGTMLQSGLIDEFIFYIAPKLMGDAGKGLFHLPWINHIADLVELSIKDIRAVGNDWRIRAFPGRKSSA